MKVSKVQIPNFVKTIVAATPLLMATQGLAAQSVGLQKDVFIKSDKKEVVDVNDESPAVKIDGHTIYPALVVDISDETLYHYDLDGYLLDSYPVKLVENKIKPGINLVDITEHNYGEGRTSPKILLSEINRSNGRVLNQPQQVIVGSEGETINDDKGIFSNVVLVDNQVAHKISENLTNEQFVLIRK